VFVRERARARSRARVTCVYCLDCIAQVCACARACAQVCVRETHAHSNTWPTLHRTQMCVKESKKARACARALMYLYVCVACVRACVCTCVFLCMCICVCVCVCVCARTAQGWLCSRRCQVQQPQQRDLERVKTVSESPSTTLVRR